MARNRTSLEEFTTVRSEGTMLPADILRRIAREDVEGMGKGTRIAPAAARAVTTAHRKKVRGAHHVDPARSDRRQRDSKRVPP